MNEGMPQELLRISELIFYSCYFRVPKKVAPHIKSVFCIIYISEMFRAKCTQIPQRSTPPGPSLNSKLRGFNCSLNPRSLEPEPLLDCGRQQNKSPRAVGRRRQRRQRLPRVRRGVGDAAAGGAAVAHGGGEGAADVRGAGQGEVVLLVGGPRQPVPRLAGIKDSERNRRARVLP